uniref:Uncharacterized protein n=1 Tax=Zonotrichia albicollis TaxID=44394 RepID=A0A8D2NE24_ZONAL
RVNVSQAGGDTRVSLWRVVLLVDHGCGDGAHEDHNPDDEAEDLSHLGAPQMPPAKRVNDGNVAIQVDAHEEEAAAIHEATKGPVVVDIVVESQGQRKCEAEVTYGQVQHVDHHYRLQATIPGQSERPKQKNLNLRRKSLEVLKSHHGGFCSKNSQRNQKTRENGH